MNTPDRVPKNAIAVFLIIGLAVTFLYWPGLHSAFYLDDPVNLKGLARANTLDGKLNFVFNNETMRALSYLSFLPQQAAWSRLDAFPFKLANLAIHVFNMLLVFILASNLGRQQGADRHKALLGAGLCTLLWGISPMHINNILYVIQRMTLLSGSFVLLAAIYFTRIPARPAGTPAWVGHAAMIGAFYVLGILCKENAILIGAHLGVLMLTITGRKHIPSWWIAGIVITPLALTTAYLFIDNRIVYGGRNFTLEQRLLTESGIMFDYLRKLLIAVPADISLFNDDYPVIQSVSDNRLVLLYIATIVGGAVLALVYRRRFPLASFAVLWFLAGHLLESTIVPLELYFEHRNYIPSFGIYFALAFLTANSNRYRLLLWPLMAAIIINAGLTSHKEISLWKSQEDFAIHAILDRPHSTRAIQLGAEYFLTRGDVFRSAALIQHAHTSIKPYASHLVYLLALKCLDDRVPLAPFAEVLANIQRLPYDRYLEKATHNIFLSLHNHECRYFNWQNYDQLLQVLQAKAPDYHTNYYKMHRVFAYRLTGNKVAALATVQSMDTGQGSIDQGFFKIYMLLEYDKKTEARQALEMLTARFHNTRDEWLNRRELAKLQKLTSTDNGTERSIDKTGTGGVTE